MTQDGRKRLRAKPPDGSPRTVVVPLEPKFYTALYWISFHRNQSLAETMRDLIHAQAQKEGL